MTIILMFFLFALSVGVLTGVIIVARGGVGSRENSLIGLNIATICAVTMLVAMDKYMGIAFSRDIAFYLIFPGVFGIIIFCMLLREVDD
ncbi:MAG: hypothetical protein V1744_08375 [Candidatus Altiarchaeota archaeon]